MFRILVGFLMINILILSCGRNDLSKLNKLSREDILSLHQNGKWNLDRAVILNENKRRASASDRRRLNDGQVSADYYMDEDKIIRKLVLRPTKYHDHITTILLKNLNYRPSNGIPYVDIDCDSLEYKIESLYAVEPESLGLSKEVTDTMSVFDSQRAIMVSIEKQCGLPSIEKHGKRTVKLFWSMVQHNDKEVKAYYYPYVEHLIQEGQLHPEKLALLTDRLLMNYGFKQVYGSQILNFKLYPIENPDSVDFRRAEIGLEPMAEYLKRFDL